METLFASELHLKTGKATQDTNFTFLYKSKPSEPLSEFTARS